MIAGALLWAAYATTSRGRPAASSHLHSTLTERLRAGVGPPPGFSLTTSSLTRTWQASTPEFVNEMDVSPLRQAVIEYSENAYRSGSLVTKTYPYRTKVQWR